MVCSDESWLNIHLSLHHSIIFFLNGWENFSYELGIERANYLSKVLLTQHLADAASFPGNLALEPLYFLAITLTEISVGNHQFRMILQCNWSKGIRNTSSTPNLGDGFPFGRLRTRVLSVVKWFEIDLAEKIPIISQTARHSLVSAWTSFVTRSNVEFTAVSRNCAGVFFRKICF